MNIKLSNIWDQTQQLINGFLERIPNIILALIALLVFYLAARGIDALVRRLTEQHKRRRNLGLVLGRLTRFSVLLVGVLVALSIVLPEFNAGGLIQLLGISSVAIGFAFRDILQNFLAGILILLTQPFQIGDQIAVDQFEGSVEDIETRATMIKTYDGRRVVIPNATIFTQPVTVNTAYTTRRSQYDVGIGYGDNIGHTKELILGVLKDIPGVVADPPPDVLVVDLAASSVNIRVRWWTQPSRADVLIMQDRVLSAIKETLSANGIDLPFPTRQILFHDQTEETDGHRARQREGWPAGGNQRPPEPRSVGGAITLLAGNSAGKSARQNEALSRDGSHRDGSHRDG